MTRKNFEAIYWNKTLKKLTNGQKFDELLAEQYRLNYLNLIERWSNLSSSKVILKTDLFAEAVCTHRAFSKEISRADNCVVGIDISSEIVHKARTTEIQCSSNSLLRYAICDVRRLPFATNSFDLIISDSTLDHFRKKNDIITALYELSRVLKPGGVLIITMDNKTNFFEPFFRLWIFFKLAPFYSGYTYSIKELKEALVKAGLNVTDNTSIIHNPRYFTRMIITLLRKVMPATVDSHIRRHLLFLDSLEYRKTKYLTAQLIAARAIKPFN